MVTCRETVAHAVAPAANEFTAEARSRRAGQSTSTRNRIHNCHFCAPSRRSCQCPAHGKLFRTCNKPSHFARSKACGKKSVSKLQAEETEEYFSFLSNNTSNEAPWRVSVKLNGADRGTSFKIDTGADVSVMPLQTYKNMSPRPLLQKTGTALRSSGGTLACGGKIRVSAKVNGKDFSLQIFVINSTVTENLPGREAATRMGLITRVDTVDEPVFWDLNEQPVKCQPVKIQLTENAQPYSYSKKSTHTTRLKSERRAHLLKEDRDHREN